MLVKKVLPLYFTEFLQRRQATMIVDHLESTILRCSTATIATLSIMPKNHANIFFNVLLSPTTLVKFWFICIDPYYTQSLKHLYRILVIFPIKWGKIIAPNCLLVYFLHLIICPRYCELLKSSTIDKIFWKSYT